MKGFVFRNKTDLAIIPYEEDKCEIRDKEDKLICTIERIDDNFEIGLDPPYSFFASRIYKNFVSFTLGESYIDSYGSASVLPDEKYILNIGLEESLIELNTLRV